MPAPLAPWIATGLVALVAGVGGAVWRARRRQLSPSEETALDQTPEGLSGAARVDEDRLDAGGSARWSGVVRVGERGPGVAVDAALLARARLRLAPPKR